MLVSNDTLTDVRLKKMALGLAARGYDILLIGKKPENQFEPEDNFVRKHIKIPFAAGPLFYLFLNIQLFFKLLFLSNYSIIWANDLDTLPAAGMASIFRFKPLVYDSHELFTEVPELQGRKFVKRVWEILERIFIKRPKVMITVCKSIANHYKNKYGVSPLVIRNVPSQKITVQPSSRKDLGLPDDMPIVIYQGAVNLGRGLEELIEAAELLPNVFFVIAGTGDLEAIIKRKIVNSSAQKRILYTGRLPYTKLLEYTTNADMGVSLEHAMGLNYYYALPNKLFDYIRVQIPVLVNNLPEMRRIVEQYKVGELLEKYEVQAIAKGIREVLNKPKDYYSKHLSKAALELNWENEAAVLDEVIELIYRKHKVSSKN